MRDGCERSGLQAAVLVLNRNYQPIRITDARDAFCLLYRNRARALNEAYEPLDFEAWATTAPSPQEDHIRTPSGALKIPKLLLLVRYGRFVQASVRLSRRNVFLRDGYTCQYCGAQLPARDLNLDHVVAKSRGGSYSWDNLVTACKPCNLRKGPWAPDERGMRLRRMPRRPSWTAMVALSKRAAWHQEWAPFLPLTRDRSRRT